MKRRDDSYQTRILDMLPTQELERLLNAELDKDSVDELFIYDILCVLRKRESPTSLAEEDTTTCDNDWQPAETKQQKQDLFTSRLSRIVAAVAVICLLITVTPAVLGAENIIELVGRWSQDIFALFRSDEPDDLSSDYVFQTDHPGLQELYDTVVEAGITQRVVPMWVPEECEIEEVQSTTTLAGTKIRVKLANVNQYIVFIFEPYTNKPLNSYPKDDVEITSYFAGGVKHYMIPNDGIWSIAWTTGDVTCSVITTYSEDVIYKILKSIYKEGA